MIDTRFETVDADPYGSDYAVVANTRRTQQAAELVVTAEKARSEEHHAQHLAKYALRSPFGGSKSPRHRA